eukprot:gene14775-31411_t
MTKVPAAKKAAEAAGDEAKPSARRDALLSIEQGGRSVQAQWAADRPFDVDPPGDGEADTGKFMCTFPYPYMNGKLHLGHAFTATKTDFAVGFQRLLGKRALWPPVLHPGDDGAGATLRLVWSPPTSTARRDVTGYSD